MKFNNENNLFIPIFQVRHVSDIYDFGFKPQLRELEYLMPCSARAESQLWNNFYLKTIFSWNVWGQICVISLKPMKMKK